MTFGIIVIVLTSVICVMEIIWNFLPTIPHFPEHLLNSLDFFLDTVFDNIQLLDIFIRIDTIKLVIPILIALINLDRIYRLLVWLLNKIPFVDMD